MLDVATASVKTVYCPTTELQQPGLKGHWEMDFALSLVILLLNLPSSLENPLVPNLAKT